MIWAEEMSLAVRIMSWIFGLMALGISGAGTWSMVADYDSSGILGVLLGAAIYAFGVVVLIRPRIASYPGHILIRNPILEYRVPWPLIDRVEADMRVYVGVADRPLIVAWAVQKTNLWAFLGRSGRPERVAERIKETRVKIVRQGGKFAEAPERRAALPPAWAYILFAGVHVAVLLTAFL